MASGQLLDLVGREGLIRVVTGVFRFLDYSGERRELWVKVQRVAVATVRAGVVRPTPPAPRAIPRAAAEETILPAEDVQLTLPAPRAIHQAAAEEIILHDHNAERERAGPYARPTLCA